MKILIVNTYDRGGAANSCIRLHKGLLLQGIDSKLLLLYKSKNIPSSFQLVRPVVKRSRFLELFIKIKHKIGKEFNIGWFKQNHSKEMKFIKNRTKGLELFSFPHSDFDITESTYYKEADIINLHWVVNFLDYESFFKKNTKPVIWTLHDMNPFTGGEHYVERFYSINSGGYPIERTYSENELLISKRNLAIKISALDTVDNLRIIAPSVWLTEEAKKSELFKKYNCQVIPYGLDVNLYNRRNKLFARQIMAVDEHKTVILFVAASVENSRKGFAYLKSALELVDRKDVLLCAIGSGTISIGTNVEVQHLGEIGDERFMSIIYSLADVFVIPSLMDNLPNTVLESLLCGTPVIGFPIGGIVDMIDDGKNGFLTKSVSVALLKTRFISF